MLSKTPLNATRLRRITGSFSWLDHRLIHDGYLQHLSAPAMLLYFFLVLVGDKNGLSCYHYDKICTLLKLDAESYRRGREELIHQDLIAFDKGYFQVLQLPPPRTGGNQTWVRMPQTGGSEPTPIAEILKILAEKIALDERCPR